MRQQSAARQSRAAAGPYGKNSPGWPRDASSVHWMIARSHGCARRLGGNRSRRIGVTSYVSRHPKLPPWSSVLLLVLVNLCTSSISAQLGRVIEHPEDLAGVWEAPDQHGGVTGMLIGVDTRIDRLPDDKSARPQFLDQLSIGLYRRAVPGAAPSGFGFFSVASQRETRWNGKRLQIDWQDRTGVDWVRLDLIWHPLTKDWTGHFARGDRDRLLTFDRPQNGAQTVSQLAGTWFDGKSKLSAHRAGF